MQSIDKENLTLLSHFLGDDDLLLSKLKDSCKKQNEGFRWICPSCFGAISGNSLEQLANQVLDVVMNRGYGINNNIPVCIKVETPPILDIIRITARTVITRNVDKTFPFPTIEDLVMRLLTRRLSNEVLIVSESAAKVKVSLPF